MFIVSMDFYQSVSLSLTLGLLEGHKVSRKQNLLYSYSCALHDWSGWNLIWLWSSSKLTSKYHFRMRFSSWKEMTAHLLIISRNMLALAYGGMFLFLFCLKLCMIIDITEIYIWPIRWSRFSQVTIPQTRVWHGLSSGSVVSSTSSAAVQRSRWTCLKRCTLWSSPSPLWATGISLRTSGWASSSCFLWFALPLLSSQNRWVCVCVHVVGAVCVGGGGEMESLWTSGLTSSSCFLWFV